MSKKIYIIGGGIAGLSAAYYLKKKNHLCNIEIFEATNSLGGRCRAFSDKKTGLKIDNGNHLCLKANRGLMHIINNLNLRGKFNFFDYKLNFYDIKNDNKYSYKALLNLPKQLNLKDKIKIIQFVTFKSRKTVDEFFQGYDNLFRLLIKPLCVSILNTPTHLAETSILRNTLLKVIFKSGRHGFQHFYPKENWDDALIGPLSSYLINKDVKIHKERRIKLTKNISNQVKHLIFSDYEVELSNDDIVIFATPSSITEEILDIKTPQKYQPIVNVHFSYKLDSEGVVGVVGSKYVEWIFSKQTHISTTLSAATNIIDETAEIIATNAWKDCKLALAIAKNIKLPKYQVIKEKKATFECSHIELNKRPDYRHPTLSNCFITGDYVQNYLPSTIEGTILNSKKVVKSIG